MEKVTTRYSFPFAHNQNMVHKEKWYGCLHKHKDLYRSQYLLFIS